MMGGGRNGRYFKWVIGVALFLSLVYVLYLYRGMKILLQERDQQLEDLNNANKRVAEELRVVVKGHTTLQDELKTERVGHQQTRRDKGAFEKKCQADLTEIKETAEGERLKLEQERDGYKNDLEEARENAQRVQTQHDSFMAHYNREMDACSKDKETIQTTFNQRLEECEQQVSSYRQEVAQVQDQQEKCEATSNQCTSELHTAQEAAQLRAYRVSSLETELSNCQNDLQSMTSQNAGLKEGAHRQPAALRKGLTEAEKNTFYTKISEKMARGEQINDQEMMVLEMLEKDQGDLNQGGNRYKNQAPFDQGNHRRSVSPQFPVHVEQGAQGGHTFRLPGNTDGNQRQFSYPRRQHWGNNVGFKRHDGMEYGQERVDGGMGIGLDRGGREKQQLPEMAEQEEVKELELEDHDQGEKEKRGWEEGDEGMDEQAFDPEQAKDGGEEVDKPEGGRQYDYNPGDIEGVADNQVPENLNLPSPNKQPMPVPDRVQEENAELDNINQPPKFENPDQAFDPQEKEEEELEREQNDGVNDFDDDYGQNQFKHDMHMDAQDRLRRMNAPNEQGGPILNQQGAGVRARQLDRGVEEAMRQEISEKNVRRREVVEDLEKVQKDELEKRLKQQVQGYGQRDHNLR